MTVCK